MTNVTEIYPERESERVYDFDGRNGFVGRDGEYGVCRDHGVQYAGVPNVARLEDCNRRGELDGSDRNRADGRPSG